MNQKFYSHQVVLSAADVDYIQSSKLLQELSSVDPGAKKFPGVLAGFAPVVSVSQGKKKLEMGIKEEFGQNCLCHNLVLSFESFTKWISAKDEKFADKFKACHINLKDAAVLGEEKLTLIHANLPTKYKNKYDNEQQYYYQILLQRNAEQENALTPEAESEENIKEFIQKILSFYSEVSPHLVEFQLLKICEQFKARAEYAKQLVKTAIDEKLKEPSAKNSEGSVKEKSEVILNICTDFKQEKILMLPAFNANSGFFDDKNLSKYEYKL